MKKFILSIAFLFGGVIFADHIDALKDSIVTDSVTTTTGIQEAPVVDETIGLDLSTDEGGDDVVVEESASVVKDENPTTSPEAVVAGPADEKNIKDSVIIK